MKRKKITFVCTGNTCRSPMAEALLKNELKGRKIKWWGVSSCGLRAEIGNPLSPHSRTALNEIGLSLENFKPKQITRKIIEASTLIVTMTEAQRKILEGCKNVVAISELCGFEIPDPYGLSLEVYRKTRDALDLACHRIVENYILKYEDKI